MSLVADFAAALGEISAQGRWPGAHGAMLMGACIALKAAIDKAENFGGVAAVRVQHLADMLAELSRPGEGR